MCPLWTPGTFNVAPFVFFQESCHTLIDLFMHFRIILSKIRKTQTKYGLFTDNTELTFYSDKGRVQKNNVWLIH